MLINGYLAEPTGKAERYGTDRFWITLDGETSEKGAWGWRLEGHHLLLSVNVVGSQVVMTPTFMGAEPTGILSDPNGGVTVIRSRKAQHVD